MGTCTHLHIHSLKKTKKNIHLYYAQLWRLGSPRSMHHWIQYLTKINTPLNLVSHQDQYAIESSILPRSICHWIRFLNKINMSLNLVSHQDQHDIEFGISPRSTHHWLQYLTKGHSLFPRWCLCHPLWGKNKKESHSDHLNWHCSNDPKVLTCAWWCLGSDPQLYTCYTHVPVPGAWKPSTS